MPENKPQFQRAPVIPLPVEGKRPNFIQLSPATVDFLCERYTDNDTLDVLAQMVGVSPKVIRRHLVEEGVEIRHPHDRQELKPADMPADQLLSLVGAFVQSQVVSDAAQAAGLSFYKARRALVDLSLIEPDVVMPKRIELGSGGPRDAFYRDLYEQHAAGEGSMAQLALQAGLSTSTLSRAWSKLELSVPVLGPDGQPLYKPSGRPSKTR